MRIARLFLRMQPGAPPLTLDDVRAHLAAAGLARQKWPEELRVVDDLPRTPSGKVPVGASVKLEFEVTAATGQKVPEWRVV